MDRYASLKTSLPGWFSDFAEDSYFSRLWAYTYGPLMKTLDSSLNFSYPEIQRESEFILHISPESQHFSCSVKRGRAPGDFDRNVIEIAEALNVPELPTDSPSSLEFEIRVDGLGLSGIRECGLEKALRRFVGAAARSANIAAEELFITARQASGDAELLEAYAVNFGSKGVLERKLVSRHVSDSVQGNVVETLIDKLLTNLPTLSEDLPRSGLGVVLVIDTRGSMTFESPMAFLPLPEFTLLRRRRLDAIHNSRLASLEEERLERAKRTPEDTQSLMYFADELWLKGEIVEAEKIFDRAISSAPSDPEPSFRFAECILAEAEKGIGNFDVVKAAALLHRCLDLTQTKEQNPVLDRLSRLYALAGDEHNALLYLRKNSWASSAEYCDIADLLLKNDHVEGALKIMYEGIDKVEHSEMGATQLTLPLLYFRQLR